MNPLLRLNFRKRIDFETIEIRKWDRRIVSCFFLSFPTANRKWQDRESIWGEELNEWFVSEGEEEQFDRRNVSPGSSCRLKRYTEYFPFSRQLAEDISIWKRFSSSTLLVSFWNCESRTTLFPSLRVAVVFLCVYRKSILEKRLFRKLEGGGKYGFFFFFFFLRFACAKSFGKWFFERENGEGGRGEAREIGGERWYLTGKIEFSNLRWIENIYNIYF